MKILCKFLAGSKAYGLATPTSDTDIRFCFLNTEIGQIIGLDRHEDQVNQTKTEDSVGYEVRRFFQLLRKTNSQVLEMLFNDNWLEVDDEFNRSVLQNRTKFLDTKYTFKSLCGYIYGEKALVNGLRQGRIGGKRKEAVEKYGYSYKNAVQALRLIYCAQIFFTKRYFPVNIRKENKEFCEFLMQIKTHPENFTKEQILGLIDNSEEEMKLAFDTRDKSLDYEFDLAYANEIALRLYYPLLKL